MPRLRYVIPAILLAALISFSIYEQQREGNWTKCLDPEPGWLSEQFPTWTGTPFFSPRCYQLSTPEDQPEGQ